MSVVDLHDLATLLLREHLLTDPHFKYGQLIEVNDGSTPTNRYCGGSALLDLNNFPPGMRKKAYYLFKGFKSNDSPDPPIEPKDFLSQDAIGTSDLSPKDLETLFWMCKSYENGFLLALSMQYVFDRLPPDTQVRIRTSKGQSITCKARSTTTLNVAKVNILPNVARYICQYEPRRVNRVQVEIQSRSLFVGREDGILPWTYLLFGDGDQPTDRVVLDLAAPLIGMRGLGGEVFVMENLEDYHSRVLSKAITRREEIGRFVRLSAATPNPLDEASNSQSETLAERVLRRLERIENGEETFCSYCGKTEAKMRCSTCQDVRYCDNVCQKSAWKYHKKWCQDKPAINGI